MALEARICPKCGSRGLVPIEADRKCFCGGIEIIFNVKKEQYVKMSDYEINKMIEEMNIQPLISNEDAHIIYNVTHSTEIIDAMIELKQKDIIEYGLKLSQFKNQLEQRNRVNQREKNQVHCPRCGSTNITAGQRGYSLLTGFVGSGSTVNRCANCGHKWKP